MAFMGILLVNVFMMIAILPIVFIILAIIFKSIGKKKKRPRLGSVGNVLLILAIIIAIPVSIVIGVFIHHTKYEKIFLPDGSYVNMPKDEIFKMRRLIFTDNEEDIDGLIELLDEEPNLIYYLDWNNEGIIDYGLEEGNCDLVEVALRYGAKFDNEKTYEHMAYEHNSMEFFLESIERREISYEDIEILKVMFDNNVSTDCDKSHQGKYSNLFEQAIWTILCNDKYVTDIEIEFIQVFIDNGLSNYEDLIGNDEKENKIIFSSGTSTEVVKDDNYYLLMQMIGR